MKPNVMIFMLLSTVIVFSALGQKKCQQRFVLFDKTVGEHSLMFYRVDRSGDCGGESSTFYTLFLLPDRVHSSSSNQLIGNWVPNLYKNMTLEKYEILTDSNGYYYLNDSAYVLAPAFDSSLDKRYQSLPKKDAKTWHWECFDKCSASPRYFNFNPEQIYRHPGGLYINYTFSEVRYYRESNFLILLTHQPLLDSDSKTTNGMIIVKVDGYRW